VDEEGKPRTQPTLNGLRYHTFLLHYESLINLIACGLVLFLLYFLDTVLALNLETDFGFSGDTVGYVYIPSMVAFLIMCPIASRLCNYVDKRVLITLSFILQTFAYFLVGPSEVLHLPK
jgi:MFS family permease